MSQFLAFKPFPFCSGPHLQTIWAGFPTWQACPPSVTRIFPLGDGDCLACEVSTPASWTPRDLTVFTIHGLCGTHRSRYQVRLGTKLYLAGVRVVRINLRGCGTGHGLARLPYHAGCSEDILTILKNFRLKSPESPFSLIGYSMGGNIALKLAGELGTDADQLLQQCIAVCPPINLHTSARLMSEPRNLFYRTLFIRWRVQAARENAKRHPEVSAKHLSPWMTFREFDECYTAPNRGFRGAMDYYTSASSELVIPRIQVDTKIVFSGDDPIIDCNALDHLQLGPHMQIFKTNRGGHVGFLGSPQQAAGIHWLDHKILHWVLDKPVAELTEAPVEESRNVDASPALQETP